MINCRYDRLTIRFLAQSICFVISNVDEFLILSMSSPYVVVSAVHEPETTVEDWWKNNQQNIDGLDKSLDHEGYVDWTMSEGVFRSMEAGNDLSIKSTYHTGRDKRVIEIIISGKKDMTCIQETGLEEVIEEINHRLDSKFTLEVYYWYNGVDRPGGVSR